MSEGAKIVKTGCGLLAVVLVVVGGVVGAAWYGGLRGEYEPAIASGDELRSGQASLPAFVPPLDGRISEERLRLYVEVRRAMHPASQRLSERMLRDDELSRQSSHGVLSSIRQARDLPRLEADVIQARNRALLDREMTLDEFTWLTYVTYWAERRLVLPPEKRRFDRVLDYGPLQRVRRLFREQVETAELTGEGLTDEWCEALRLEQDRLEEAWFRLPWEGEVPLTIRESLAPHALELGELFHVLTEDYELGEIERRGVAYKRSSKG
ncbi:MAG: hypothetical protein AAF533_05660 [Acidobacteriota bacterium]